jgi:cystathionine gamma-synthase
MFNGRGDVLAGSLVINSVGRYADQLLTIVPTLDLPLPYYLDACVLEVNSRNFLSRSHKINKSALKLAKSLQLEPGVEKVYYCSESVEYNAVLRHTGGMSAEMIEMGYMPGYGCLMSIILAPDVDEKVSSRLFLRY